MPIQKWSDQIWVAMLSDEPALSEDLVSLKDQAERVDPTPSVVLDLSGVDRLNSSNLSQMLRIRKAVIDGDAKMKIAGLSDSLWVVFMTTGLDKVFDFAGDVPTALAGLQMEQ